MNLGRVNAAFGLFSAEIFISLWFLAAFFAPEWNLGELSLSDLGVIGTVGGEICFNMACSCGGLFGVMFGIYVTSKSVRERILGAMIIVACFGLAGIGIINLNYGSLHYITATTYSVFSVICVIISIVLDHKHGDLDFAILSSILLGFCTIAVVSQPFVVYEPVAVSCQCFWIAGQSIKYMRKEDKVFDGPIKLPFRAGTPGPFRPFYLQGGRWRYHVQHRGPSFQRSA